MRYRVPDNVAYIDGADLEAGNVLLLTLLPDGQSVRLEGIGRQIWAMAAEGSDVVAEIAKMVGQQPDTISGDVAAFLADLVGRGLLTEVTRSVAAD